MSTTNLLFVGLGGQGVLLASELVAQAAFLSDFDVKKSEVHGMSQRGGSVCSQVRYGEKVYSALVPVGEADWVLALNAQEGAKYVGWLRSPANLLLPPTALPAGVDPRALNVYLVGKLSRRLDIGEEMWHKSIHKIVRERFWELNTVAFSAGRNEEAEVQR